MPKYSRRRNTVNGHRALVMFGILSVVALVQLIIQGQFNGITLVLILALIVAAWLAYYWLSLEDEMSQFARFQRRPE